MTLTAVLAALAVAWHGVAALAWHGWAAFTAIAAAAILALGAAQVAETAKTYNTEDRVDEITRRNWTHVWAHSPALIVGNGGSNRISHPLTIPGGQATVASQYEVYIEGHGNWGNSGNRNTLSFQIRWGGVQYATCSIAYDALNFSAPFSFWCRGTITIWGNGTQCTAQTSGCMWDTAAGALPSNSFAFGNTVHGNAINTNGAADLLLWATWGGTGNAQMEVMAYTTRISRRGA